MGRFVTQDPIGLEGGSNLYVFAPSTLVWSDSLGLSSDYIDQFGDYYGASAKYANTDFSLEILSKTLSDMKKYKLVNSDQFFHCIAFCKVSKSNAPDKNLALGYGIIKEGSDWIQNLTGKYSDNKLSKSEMFTDMKKDMAVNKYGFKCPSDQSCAQRCEKFINKEHIKTKEVLKQKGYL